MTDSLVGYLHQTVLHPLRLMSLRVRAPDRVCKGNPFRQIWVDPEGISTTLPRDALQQADHHARVRKGRFCKFSAIGFVEGGTWDRQVKPYEPRKSLLFDALTQRYRQGVSWNRTAFHAAMSEIVEQGGECWNGARSIADIDARCRRADRLMESIRKNGFRVNPHPVVVCIGSAGALIKAGNGQHRIMLGLITGAKIPVLPVVRHRSWEEIRNWRSTESARHKDHPDMLPRR